MDINELRQKPHLSVSSVNDYVDCGLLYKFSRVDRHPPDYKADSLIYGSAIHKVLAEYNQSRIMGDQFRLTDFQDRFKTYWQDSAEDNSKIRYSRGKSFDAILKEGLGLLKAFHSKLPKDNFEVLAVEEPFILNIEGLDVPFIGIIDLIESDESGTVIVSDYKTSKKAYTRTQVDRNFQLTVYQLAASQNGYADQEILLRFDCLIKTKTPQFKQYYTVRAPNSLGRAVKKIRTVREGIQKGVFVPNDTGWKCDYCAYKSYCDRWFLTH